MTDNEQRLIASTKKFYRAKMVVKNWSNEQGVKGNIVTNGQCPYWNDYVEAETEMWKAIQAVGEE